MGYALTRHLNRTLGWLAPGLIARQTRLAYMSPRDLPPRDWELPLLEQAERITLRFGLSALRWGSGPSVLLMHGWEGRPTQFSALIAQLVAAGYTAIALDGPAHGHSPGSQANVVSFARALLEASAELPPLKALIGHSMGGASAMLALQMGLRAEVLVSISAPGRLHGVLGRYAQAVGLPPPARSAFIRAVEHASGIPVANVDVARYRLDLPGLIVHAEDDPLVPVGEAQIIHDAWFDSRLLRLEGGGHQRLLADPRVLEAVMALLLGSAEKAA